MNKFRTFAVLFILSIGCKPIAESQTISNEPKQRTQPIPATVSASRRTPVVVVAHNVLPSVVNIQTEATMTRRTIDPFFDPFGMFGGNQTYKSQSLGSGFVWSADGIIVTNNHVVEGASKITVAFNDGTQLTAKLIGVDPDSDVAVLRVTARNLVAAPIGTSADLLIGESVVAVGNPFGLSGTVTTGVVSALGRSVPSKEAGRTFTDFIQTDTSINPGNSGGPLLNIEGKVIGINTMIYANAQGIGFAIPVDRAKKVIQDILRFGQVQNAWIGAVTSTLTPEEAKRLGLSATKGALVERIFSGSPAEQAGLKPGDVITTFGDKPVDSREAFSTFSSTLGQGQSTQLGVIRGSSVTKVSVKATTPPKDLGLTILESVCGVRVGNQRSNVVITDVVRGSRAERIGITPGDVIVGVNGTEVRSSDDLNDQINKSAERSSIVLDVAHGGVIYALTFPMGT